MSSSVSPVDVVVVPIHSRSDEHDLLLPATVLSSWFGAPVQLVTNDPAEEQRLAMLTNSLGTEFQPVVVVGGSSFAEAVVAHLGSTPSALCVTAATETGFAIARSSTRPTFIAGAGSRRRLAAGPLVLELDGRESDADVLATAAIWGRHLELGVRVVSPEGGDSQSGDDNTEVARQRMQSIGVDVGVDRLRPHGLDAAVLVARTRAATALIAPRDRLDEVGFVELATREGVSVLVVPDAAPTDAEPHHQEWREWVARAEAPTHERTGRMLAELSSTACWQRLRDANVGRLGTVDHGWPAIVPVNFSVSGGDVFIRSIEGAKSAAAERGDVVCLQIDGIDVDAGTGWSVMARGNLTVISDPDVMREAWANDPQPFVEASRWRWLRFVPFALSGRMLVEPSLDEHERSHEVAES